MADGEFDAKAAGAAEHDLFQRMLTGHRSVCLGCSGVAARISKVEVFLNGQQVGACVFAAENGKDGIVVQRMLQRSTDSEAKVIGPARWMVQTGEVEIRRG